MHQEVYVSQGQYGYTVGANFDREGASLFSLNNHHVNTVFPGFAASSSSSSSSSSPPTLAPGSSSNVASSGAVSSTSPSSSSSPSCLLGSAPSSRRGGHAAMNALMAALPPYRENPVDLSSARQQQQQQQQATGKHAPPLSSAYPAPHPKKARYGYADEQQPTTPAMYSHGGMYMVNNGMHHNGMPPLEHTFKTEPKGCASALSTNGNNNTLMSNNTDCHNGMTSTFKEEKGALEYSAVDPDKSLMAHHPTASEFCFDDLAVHFINVNSAVYFVNIYDVIFEQKF
ncbi:hypothetical protein CAPTEDRAFT_208261 [Capitella teleta]|uniref:Uncharacterized protein n=1 Tax=Capitella teleta TaxID=283909 RepID=R7U397_CAPTE|nr:hypothetical protein CAPTEDRAFT_208261 [Capitella teleta]|eukprot:ELT98156.1 hypothetical protein CAPTEDRAFT_208261 [Capitella teleta]